MGVDYAGSVHSGLHRAPDRPGAGGARAAGSARSPLSPPPGAQHGSGHARRRYLRLPAWFMVWFVIALGLFGRDSYRQVFKWLQPFRRHGTPGRSTLCEARQRLGPMTARGPAAT